MDVDLFLLSAPPVPPYTEDATAVLFMYEVLMFISLFLLVVLTDVMFLRCLV